MLTEATSSELIFAIERNVESAFCTLARSAPNAELVDTPSICRYAMDIKHPMANIVVRSELSDLQSEKVVVDTLNEYKDRGRPMMWFVGPSTTPSNLGDLILEKGGTKLFETPGMVADLTQLGDQSDAPEGIRLAKVEDAETLEDWLQTVQASFRLPREVAGLFGNFRPDAESPFPCYIAYLDNNPVAVSALHVSHGVAGIYCVGTTSEARGKGIGSAITRMPMLEAKALGYQYAILQSSEAGFNVYQRLGFREYCRFQRYGYNLEATETSKS